MSMHAEVWKVLTCTSRGIMLIVTLMKISRGLHVYSLLREKKIRDSGSCVNSVEIYKFQIFALADERSGVGNGSASFSASWC